MSVMLQLYDIVLFCVYLFLYQFINYFSINIYYLIHSSGLGTFKLKSLKKKKNTRVSQTPCIVCSLRIFVYQIYS